jgi:hypothetical protein
MFGSKEQCTLVLYMPMKGRIVLLISSLHIDNKIDPDSGDKCKAEVIKFHNCTNSVVETVDKMFADYSAGRKTYWWPVVIFNSMFNKVAINALIQNSTGLRGQFSRTLVQERLQQHTAFQIPRDIRQKITALAEKIPEKSS